MSSLQPGRGHTTNTSLATNTSPGLLSCSLGRDWAARRLLGRSAGLQPLGSLPSAPLPFPKAPCFSLGLLGFSPWIWIPTNLGLLEVSISMCSVAFLLFHLFSFFLFFLNFYFYFILLYNTVLVLPYIDMNPPRVYMRSQT